MAPKSSIDVFLRLHGQRKFSKEVAASAAQLEAMGVKGARSIASFAAAGDKMKKFGKSWTRNVSLPVTLGAVLAGKAAVDWESAFTGVRKTVNATETQYASMEKGLRKMALQVPVAATDLAGIAEAAGQLGIKRESILSFTRTIADLGVSTNLAGEEGATTLARFANITQMPQSQFRRLGSTIVALGNAGASTESDIAAMGLRLAAAGNYVGMSEPQILAFANALSSVGIEAEAGGTAMSKVFKTLNSAVSAGGKELANFAAVSGLSSGDFAAAWKRDAATATVSWIEGIARLEKEGKDVPKLLYNLSPKLRGDRVQDAIQRASGAGALLRESLGLGTKAWQENNALSREAAKRYETVASQLQILKNKVIDAGISLGQELLPPMIDFANFAGPAVGAVAEAFGGLPGPIKASALGFLILTGPVVSGLGYLAGGVGRVLVLTSKLAQAATIFKAVMSPNVMTEGSGFGAAFGAASKKAGVTGALQTAKGFGLSLAPAIAAYGVGNVVTSAMSGDWRDAGFKMGGAAAGGIAGFMLGGPLGAMLGVGLGSLGGQLANDLFGGLFGGGKKTLPVLEKLARSSREVTRYFKEQKEAGRALASAGHRVDSAHRELVTSSRRLDRAEGVLSATKRRSTGYSEGVARAEWRVTRAQDAHRRASRRLNRADRQRGQQLQWFKQIARSTVLEERNQINNLRRRLDHVKQLFRTEKNAGAGQARLTELAKRGSKVSNELAGSQKKYKETLVEASDKAGPKFARFLSNASRSSLEFGGAIKVINSRLRVTQELTQSLSATNFLQVPDLSNMGAGLPAGPERPLPGSSGPRKGGKGGRNGRRNPFAVPAPRTQRLPKGSFNGALRIVVESHNVLELDGKVAAENTTRQAKRRANRK